MTLSPGLVPDGFVVVVKEDCATCRAVVLVLEQLRAQGTTLTIYTQDDPTFPAGLEPRDDRSLEVSYRLDLETVPTLMHIVDGRETGRVVGWNRAEWQALTSVADLGADLPRFRPGCGALNAEPGAAERLEARYGSLLQAGRVELGLDEDEIEACYARGWTDGLPVVPPTPERVLRLLSGTRRPPSEIVAVVPPDLAPCSVEKVAVNAVMAGCRPSELPVVLAAVEAACTDSFNMHGLLATTYASGPVVVVNGPIRRSIGMNAGGNALGQGNRANAVIGRALQLVVRNVGGGRPGGVDRATLGSPGKYTFCFAEDEEGSPWEPLSVERGVAPGVSAVTLFAGEGPRTMMDQLSRTPESLARSFAAALLSVAHPKLALAFDALVVVSPEHARVFREGGWDKARTRREILALTERPGADLVRGADGCAEGMPSTFAESTLPKFMPDGLLLVYAGGGAGLFSAIIGGWVSGDGGSRPTTKEITV